jgi:hypothetical protein
VSQSAVFRPRLNVHSRQASEQGPSSRKGRR